MIKRFFGGMGIFIIPGMVLTEVGFHAGQNFTSPMKASYCMYLVTEPKTRQILQEEIH